VVQPPPYGQPPDGQPPYGQPPYGQPPYGQPPFGMPPDPYYAQFGPKQPGCVPLRPLGLGDILDGSFKVIRRNPRATLGLSAIAGVVQATVLALIQIFALHQLSNGIDNSNPDDPQVDVGSTVGGIVSTLAGFLVAAIFAALLTGMLTVIITEDVLGKKLSISETWARIRPRGVRLGLLSLLVSVVPFIGLMFCIAPGVWLWGLWAVAIPAMVVENAKVGQSLGRSRSLVHRMFWRVWGIRALGVLMVGFMGALIGIPFAIIAEVITGSASFGFGSAAAAGLPVAYVLITSIGSVISTTLTAPIRAGIDALLYVDLRMRKEGLDIVLRQTAAAALPNRGQ
jgi:hypothetical protein